MRRSHIERRPFMRSHNPDGFVFPDEVVWLEPNVAVEYDAGDLAYAEEAA